MDRAFATSAAAVVAVVATALPAQRTQTRQLKPVRVNAREWRSGHGLTKPLPARAFCVKCGKTKLWLWDLDNDGKITFSGQDGLALDGCPFVVPLPDTLLLPEGQFLLSSPRARTLGLQRQTLDLADALVTEAAAMTRLRVRHGKKPLRLDTQASKECALHCNYLQIHLPDKNGSADWHSEQVGAEGYTAAGARAAAESCIYPQDDAAVALAWTVATIWHSAPVMDPDVSAFGFAAEKGFSLIRPIRGGNAASFVHPADGAEDVPLTFGYGGETPNPVPGSRYATGCGYPIYMRLPAGTGRLTGATLAGPDDKPVDGTRSCPKAPANGAWPTNSGCAAFVPARPLEPGLVYVVTFSFEGGEPVTWRFRTRAAKGKHLKRWRYSPKQR